MLLWVAWSQTYLCFKKICWSNIIKVISIYGSSKILLRFYFQNHHREPNWSLSLLTLKVSRIERQRLQPLYGIVVSSDREVSQWYIAIYCLFAPMLLNYLRILTKWFTTLQCWKLLIFLWHNVEPQISIPHYLSPCDFGMVTSAYLKYKGDTKTEKFHSIPLMLKQNRKVLALHDNTSSRQL